MYVVEGLNKEFAVMPIDGKLRMIIRQIMKSKPFVEIEVDTRGFKRVKAPKEIAADKFKLRYALKRDQLLRKAQKVAKNLLKEAQQGVLKPYSRVKVEILKKQLLELRKLLDKYEKYCKGHIVFVKSDYIREVAPAKEEFSVLVHPDFLQLILYSLVGR